jgi:hypothetical protein
MTTQRKRLERIEAQLPGEPDSPVPTVTLRGMTYGLDELPRGVGRLYALCGDWELAERINNQIIDWQHGRQLAGPRYASMDTNELEGLLRDESFGIVGLETRIVGGIRNLFVVREDCEKWER